ncbi:MAG: S41 family peptidase [Bryobacterales bacterium]|nr:S41 family peptidase [Bryobacterales bacterium]
MSEKVCDVLVRLYPSDFRQRYREEAFRLLMDRARDEKGLFPKLRLGLNLIRDLVATALIYRLRSPILQVSHAANGELCFQFVGSESPAALSLSMGLLVSMILLVALPVGLGGSGSGAKWNFPRQPIMAQLGTQRAEPQSTSEVPVSTEIDVARRHEIILAIAAKLKEHYFDSAAAKKATEALRAVEISGGFENITNIRDFASALTRHLRAATRDMHIEVIYSAGVLPNGPPPAQSAEALARYRTAMLRQNCTFEAPEMLPNNIGYLKFNFFPDTAACKDKAQAAMGALNEAQSVILDLRENGGGFGNMVIMYSPRDNVTEQSWTHSPVLGTKLADKPVYLLTSSRTISAAEDFCFNLKMLKRATIVGETTQGSAHAGVIYRIDDHLGIAIPAIKPINPYSKVDWESVGVAPDVKVNAADALTTAVALAGKKASRR